MRNQKNFRSKWQWKDNNSKPIGCSKSTSKREVYSKAIRCQETRKISNRQLSITPKKTGEKRTKKKLAEGNKS